MCPCPPPHHHHHHPAQAALTHPELNVVYSPELLATCDADDDGADDFVVAGPPTAAEIGEARGAVPTQLWEGLYPFQARAHSTVFFPFHFGGRPALFLGAERRLGGALLK